MAGSSTSSSPKHHAASCPVTLVGIDCARIPVAMPPRSSSFSGTVGPQVQYLFRRRDSKEVTLKLTNSVLYVGSFWKPLYRIVNATVAFAVSVAVLPST
mmetsp:Transcript_26448/g.72730  ORF Transcript_26448/g.72730 Transcript_26448/m.72730 type:complete len:99 (-) Transcript_26448:2422-2718(-)